MDALTGLVDRGAQFLTWHDLLDGAESSELDVILQFDVDGASHSMQRIYAALADLGIRATLMVHRESRSWYAYDVDDDIEWLRVAQGAGWAVGYHNNAIGNVLGEDRVAEYSDAVLAQAVERFEADLRHLQTRLDPVRTYTHHGGNAINRMLPVSGAKLGIQGVDKADAPLLWSTIRGGFSDGGFRARPTSLRHHCESLKAGRWFFRNHPVKYANFQEPFDRPPIDASEVRRLGTEPSSPMRAWIERERDTGVRWTTGRLRDRTTRRASFASLEKPISARFSRNKAIDDLIRSFRDRRSSTPLRQFPAPEGDPRVFWWRVLDAWAPNQGRILNVGAMPLDRRDETTAFTGEAEVLELDIDRDRKPHFLADITDNQALDSLGKFDAVLFFGLGCVGSPSAAVRNILRLLQPSGIALYGFPASTNPTRGALWHRSKRVVWRPSAEPLSDVRLRGNLWSFDEEGVRSLFGDLCDSRWEFFNHVWFTAHSADRAR